MYYLLIGFSVGAAIMYLYIVKSGLLRNRAEFYNHQKNKKFVTELYLLEIGFKRLENYTVHDPLLYNLGNYRYLSISSINTPNEMIFLCQYKDNQEITDLVCIHNYDFDGYLTIEKLEYLLTFFK